MKLFVWNVRGAGNRHFLNEPKEYLRLHRPHLLVLLETYISGDRANEFHEQFITIEVNGLQASSWLLTAIYMSPNQLKTKVGKKSNSLDPLYDIHGLLRWTLMTPFHLRNGIIEGFLVVNSLRHEEIVRTPTNVLVLIGRCVMLLRECTFRKERTWGSTSLSGRGKPFRFQVAWTSHTDAPITLALHELSIGLSEWNKEVFRNLFRKKRTPWAPIQGIQNCLNREGNGHLLKLDRQLKEELKELAGCKSKCLTLARRITLIKSIICAIPAYVDVNCEKARSIHDDIDRKIRRFL
ncbi:LOW QUALITY PROTEIN: hypothetical protein Cgig2_026760 [Carnegiea gigantea]|uniref:Endonuclease/exonuclease/phosphatase domain-containing protein n=1 Tax=Carnegiea gigantea TaxID=171969 RepID=A0A9Q1JSM8_9CARY|nr:LOW QUALITY PROTEIN: hypothetical protein Cgig2_026760 [Carnegiea gigantea]